MIILDASLSTTALSLLIPSVVASGLALLTGLLARPKQKADTEKTSAEADGARIVADLSMSRDAREWVAQAMERVAASDQRADAAEEKAAALARRMDDVEAKADDCADEVRRLQRKNEDLTEQVRRLSGEPA